MGPESLIEYPFLYFQRSVSRESIRFVSRQRTRKLLILLEALHTRCRAYNSVQRASTAKSLLFQVVNIFCGTCQGTT